MSVVHGCYCCVCGEFIVVSYKYEGHDKHACLPCVQDSIDAWVQQGLGDDEDAPF